jgi:glycerol-1-phosphate dehydrogenase [NAD(P)+]
MNLPFDPASPDFKNAIRALPGYPPDEDLPIHAMVFESDAYARLPELLTQIGAQREQPLLVVVDELPIQRAGVELKPFLLQFLQTGGWNAERVVLAPHDHTPVHTDMYQIECVQARLTRGATILALGSGTVTDVSKHAAYLFERAGGGKIPFAVMPTANSVSAYTSNTASVEVGGVKKTLPSRYLDALVCDLETLASAPRSATVAGVGDLVVAFGSFADWFLAARVGHDPNYSDLPRTLIGPLDEIFLENAADVRGATPRGTALLAKLLALEGVSQSLAHTSAPFSGFEHSISHLLDLMVKQQKQTPILHGTQVALLTVLTTLAFQQFMDEFDPARVNLDECFPSRAEMQARIQRAFASLDPTGAIADECWSEYQKKLDHWHAQRARFETFLREWDGIRAQLQSMVRPPELLIEILRRMGSPTHLEQLNAPIPEAQLRFAFENASLIRSRFTLGDLFLFLNWDRERLWTRIWNASRALASAPISER